MSADVHRHTPTLSALDSRGLSALTVSYHRERAEQSPQARLSRQAHDWAGRVIAAWDARLIDTLHGPNQVYVYSLGGRTLKSDNVDAGQRIHRYADTGLRRETWDSRDSHWQTDYDALLRPLAIYESNPTQARRVAQRFTYADNAPSNAVRNLCGRLIRHDDEAGSVLKEDYGLRAETLSERRHFLADMDAPDWPSSFTGRDLLLEPDSGATTGWQYSPTGELMHRIDAANHRQTMSYTLAGHLERVTLHTRDGIEREVFHSAAYNAFGQLERQMAGNGVISRDVHDSADGRLLTRRAARADGSVVQDLSYGYDPVGNIVWIEDHTQPTRHFDNQRIDGISTFTHDTLYQLIEASGREAAGARSQPGSPHVGGDPGDTSQLLNYTEHYQYDAGGNLLQLRHIGKHTQYTRHMQVAPGSNRSLPHIEQRAAAFEDAFDANGNLLKLENGQTLQWNGLDQLNGVVMLTREGDADDDIEHYRYDGQGQRARKLRITRAGATSHSTEVRYLPGIELHTRQAERLQVISVEAGPCTVRFLHWTAGQPCGIDNDQLRYGLTDHLNSCSLELDDQAQVLSHEGYYPYGGTAWWAARSALQAKYKTVRYSGKERDASGLYYYGFRYYAPWLQRWINPDPVGDADGLNLYKMVNNSPVSLCDPNGLMLQTVVRRGTVVAGTLGYQFYKHGNSGQANDSSQMPAADNSPREPLGTADKWLEKSQQHTMIPLEQIKKSFTGRWDAIVGLSKGEAPAVTAVANGAAMTAIVAEFAAHGDTSNIDKTSLAKSAVIDTVHNTDQAIKGLAKAAHTGAVIATLPAEQQDKLTQEMQRRVDEVRDGVVVSVGTGMAVGGALGAAAAAVPYLPAKVILTAASVTFKVAGGLHVANEMATLHNKANANVSNELGKNALAQMDANNRQNREQLVDRIRHLAP